MTLSTVRGRDPHAPAHEVGVVSVSQASWLADRRANHAVWLARVRAA